MSFSTLLFVQSHLLSVWLVPLFTWMTRMYSMSSFSNYLAPHSYVCEQFIYSQNRSTYFLQQNRQIDHEFYKSLTDIWMRKLGLWPRNSFSWNIGFEFSVLGLCSVCQCSDLQCGTVCKYTTRVQFALPHALIYIMVQCIRTTRVQLDRTTSVIVS